MSLSSCFPHSIIFFPFLLPFFPCYFLCHVPYHHRRRYVFPGIGLAASVAGVSKITDRMLYRYAIDHHTMLDYNYHLTTSINHLTPHTTLRTPLPPSPPLAIFSLVSCHSLHQCCGGMHGVDECGRDRRGAYLPLCEAYPRGGASGGLCRHRRGAQGIFITLFSLYQLPFLPHIAQPTNLSNYLYIFPFHLPLSGEHDHKNHKKTLARGHSFSGGAQDVLPYVCPPGRPKKGIIEQKPR